jgi:hypothetical protein
MIRPVVKRSAFSVMSSLPDIAKRLVRAERGIGCLHCRCRRRRPRDFHCSPALQEHRRCSLEGTIAYDRNSLQAYVGPSQSPRLKVCILQKQPHYYPEPQSAMLYRYRANLQDYPYCVGVGVTSALVSTKERSKSWVGHVVATLADGTEWKLLHISSTQPTNSSGRRYFHG